MSDQRLLSVRVMQLSSNRSGPKWMWNLGFNYPSHFPSLSINDTAIRSIECNKKKSFAFLYLLIRWVTPAVKRDLKGKSGKENEFSERVEQWLPDPKVSNGVSTFQPGLLGYKGQIGLSEASLFLLRKISIVYLHHHRSNQMGHFLKFCSKHPWNESQSISSSSSHCSLLPESAQLPNLCS